MQSIDSKRFKNDTLRKTLKSLHFRYQKLTYVNYVDKIRQHPKTQSKASALNIWGLPAQMLSSIHV